MILYGQTQDVDCDRQRCDWIKWEGGCAAGGSRCMYTMTVSPTPGFLIVAAVLRYNTHSTHFAQSKYATHCGFACRVEMNSCIHSTTVYQASVC